MIYRTCTVFQKTAW